MMVGALFALALIAAIAGSAGAQTPSSPAPPASAALSPSQSPDIIAAGVRPMRFTLRRGAPNACGPGCSEWIEAEGIIAPGAAVAFAEFAARNPGEGRPVVIDAPGGDLKVAFALGRQIRKARHATIIARTTLDPDGRARLVPGAACEAACFFAFAGGVSRSVDPGSTLRITPLYFRLSTGGELPQGRQARLIAGYVDEARVYFREMGLDASLADDFNGLSATPFTPTPDDLARRRIVTGDRRT